MINLLLGQPGGGKSYEAVTYHILPALEQGRKVITNLPLNLVNISTINIDYLHLIDLRRELVSITRKERKWNLFHRVHDEFTVTRLVEPFSTKESFGDDWRHPISGVGALYVIDECHKAIPAKGTLKEVDEWFAEHRHELCDVLLITQSYAKLSKAVVDAVQVVYRCKKATAFGSNDSYIRKVQDGVRGEVVNTTIRTYNSAYFKYYNSHTKSNASAVEALSSDIIPFWKRWPVIGTAICAVIFVLMLAFSDVHLNPMKLSQAQSAPLPTPSLHKPPEDLLKPVSMPIFTPISSAQPVAPALLTSTSSVAAPVALDAKVSGHHPYDRHELHIIGRIHSDTRDVYRLSASQNGQPLFSFSTDEFKKAGYTFQSLNDCTLKATYDHIEFFITCDMPHVGAQLAAANATPATYQ